MGVQHVVRREELMRAHIEQADKKQSLQPPRACRATKMGSTCGQAAPALLGSTCLMGTSNPQLDLLRLLQMLLNHLAPGEISPLKRKRKAHLPLLSRESRDTVADDNIRKAEGDPEDQLNAYKVARQESTSDTQKLGANAGFAAVTSLYDQQDKVMKVLAHRIVQKARAQKSFAHDLHEKGGRVQYLLEWADSVVLKEHLQILEDNGHTAFSIREFSQLGFGPARFLVKVPWQPIWEPEARLCEHAPHEELVDEYRRNDLECSPMKLQAQNIDRDQCKRLQQGLDVMTRPCNAYREALKTHLHISLDPINPDFDIVATGSATTQCENISDCYAKEPPTGRPQTL